MRRVIYSATVAAAFSLLALPALAAFVPADWTNYKPVISEASGLVRLTLDDEVFAGAKNDLSDLRVVDQSGIETPYVAAQSRVSATAQPVAARLLNNSYVPGQMTTVIIDLTGNKTPVNRLTIITPTENFQRNVRVFGSDDRQEWRVLADRAYIYDYTDRRGATKVSGTAVSFPESVYPYLKLEIDAQDKPVAVSRVEVVKYVPESLREYERKLAVAVEENAVDKTTVLTVDLGASGIPTSRLRLAANGENFNRSVRILGSNDKDKWLTLGDGYIFRYNTDKFRGENLEVAFAESHYRYLRALIDNLDNAPLTGWQTSLFSGYRELLFEANAGRSYLLYYGNAKAVQPQYDLKSYIGYLDTDQAGAARLGAATANPEYRAPAPPVVPFTERYKWFLPSALAAACLMLFGLVYRFLKTGNAKS